MFHFNYQMIMRKFSLFAIALMASVFSIAADFQVGSLYYNFVNNSDGTKSVEVTSSVKSPWNSQSNYAGLTTVVIPESVSYSGSDYTVTRVGKYAFYGSSDMTSVTIPQTVTSIGELAFYYCSSLSSLVVPESVTSIEESAFGECFSMTSITLPSGITEIGRQTLSGCSALTSLTIPAGVTSIGDYAMEYCSSLESISLPSGVTSIGRGVFYSCSSLTGITFPSSVVSIGIEVLSGCSSMASIVVEEGNSTYDSRENCNALIETASNTLIVGCKSSVIPTTITAIEEYAFSGCKGLTSIAIPESVTTIADGVFNDCSSLASIELHSQLTSIGEYAFFGCSALNEITIPKGVTSIGYSAFLSCSGFATIAVEEGNEVYDSRENCNAIIETATNTLLIGCKNSQIPEGITSIYEWAFYECGELTEITIPSTVTYIGSNAFYDCYSLTKVTCKAVEVPELDWGVFYYVPVETATLYVPEASLHYYKAVEQWRDFSTILPISGDITSVEDVDTMEHGESVKVLRDGRLMIEREGKTYGMLGQVIE